MIIVGEALPEPEAGWRRIEDSDTNILYEGTWDSHFNTAYSGGSRHFCLNTSENSKIKFNFVGSNFLIISSLYTTYSDKIEVKIDGEVVDYYSLATKNLNKAVAYIKEGLEFREHSIELTKINKGTFSTDFILDAIDIDANGEIKPFRKWEDKFLITTESNNVYSFLPNKITTESAIPKMTSNTSPSGKAFAESISSASYDAWYAFNQVDDNEGYASVSGRVAGHLGYEFPAKIAIAKYAVRSMNSASNLYKLPKSWMFEGSIDGVGWDLLDTQANQSWTTVNTDKEYLIKNPKPYKKYRIKWSENNGFPSYTDINELKMYEHIPGEIVEIETSSENNFINHGMDAGAEIDLNSIITKVSYLVSDNETLDSGKVFRKEIDTLSKSIKNVSIK
ncbi:hypothetical protein [Paenibacillus bouchesdurhonensis]|uniref:hypothetical protein n=1 Tax=Paenibacillus bouchesdurhonensis TaxID=1870990 RepID=UPI000DA6272B|nr:hypothetical protein [Paenibacillus bouchesdurhonensis]